MLLRGVPSRCRRLSATSASTSPLGAPRPRGAGAVPAPGGGTERHAPPVPSLDVWPAGAALSTLVTPPALHGVAVASVTDPELRGFETAVVRALWGPARVSRAKEVIFTVLSKGHRVSPIMHTRYERLFWLARQARRLGVTQVFAQAIWESGALPPGTGPVGRALRTAASLGWTPHEGWWCWEVPGQDHPMHCLQEGLRQLHHRVRDSLRCHFARRLEARRPVTFGALGDGAVGRPAVRRCGQPPRSWTSRCCAGSWPEPCGRRPGSRPRLARQRRVPALRRGARGRGPRPEGLPGMERHQRDVAPLAARRGGGYPWPGPAEPVALLPAQGGTFPPPASAGGGPGPPRRVSVLFVLHVFGGPRGPDGGRRGGSAGPWRPPFPGAPASAAPQPIPLGCLRWPHTGGCRPPPAAAAPGGAAGLEAHVPPVPCIEH